MYASLHVTINVHINYSFVTFLFSVLLLQKWATLHYGTGYYVYMKNNMKMVLFELQCASAAFAIVNCPPPTSWPSQALKFGCNCRIRRRMTH